MNILGIFISLFLINNVSTTYYEEVFLDKCIDGDTAYLLKDNQSLKFRFLAIDTPESVHPMKKVEPFGLEASDYTCQLLTNAKKILIEYDPKSAKTDKYGRNLAWVWVDDELLQQKLVANGFGQVAYIYGDYKYKEKLCANQKQAQEKKLNIWSNAKYQEGYCKNIDVSDVALEIKREENINENNINNNLNSKEKIILFFLTCLVLLNMLLKKNKFKIKFGNRRNKI